VEADVEGGGEPSAPDPPVKKDLTRLVNDPSEDAAGPGVAAAGSGAALPVKPPQVEHAATDTATVARPASGGKSRRSAARRPLRVE
jgi:hypothetical protein